MGLQTYSIAVRLRHIRGLREFDVLTGVGFDILGACLRSMNLLPNFRTSQMN